MGVSLNAQEGHVEILEHVEEIMAQMWNRTYSAWQQIEFLYRLSPTGKDFYRRVKIVRNYIDEQIAIFKKLFYEEKEKLKGKSVNS